MMREQAEEYAALIMEELDRDNKGYIEVCWFDTILYLFYKNTFMFTNLPKVVLPSYDPIDFE